MRKSLLSVAISQLGITHHVADQMQSITIWRGVEKEIRPPYAPEVERKARRAAWGQCEFRKSKKWKGD